jgi:hypothetical protein
LDDVVVPKFSLLILVLSKTYSTSFLVSMFVPSVKWNEIYHDVWTGFSTGALTGY